LGPNGEYKEVTPWDAANLVHGHVIPRQGNSLIDVAIQINDDKRRNL